MIEIICNEEDDKEKNAVGAIKSSIRRPKNIKQIGDVSSDKKIYIEDYAFTYINSIAYNNPSESQVGVLLGEAVSSENEKCVFIKGVIKARLGSEVEEKGIYFNEYVWNGIYSDIEKYFSNLSVVGWFAAIPQITTERMLKLKKLHLDNFAGSMKTLYLIDTVEKEENFYLYENGELKKQKGYVCFYERNYEMQEYMLERRMKPTTEENTDKVMKSIRNIIREKEELKEQQKNMRFMYCVSGFMAVVVLVIGINLMSSYERMKEFDKSINGLMVQLSNNISEGRNYDDEKGIVPVNKLEGGVYPLEDNTVEDKGYINAQEDKTEGRPDSVQESKTENKPEEKTTQEAATGAPTIYTVKTGDTIIAICKRYYGDTAKCAEVIAYNNLGDGNLLFVGQEIKLP